MPKKIKDAIQLDADVCNALVLPVAGCHAGAGIHITIPPDFVARVQAGEQVAGCTYHAVWKEDPAEPVALSLIVTEAAEALLNDPSAIATLPIPLRSQAAKLLGKLQQAEHVP